MTCERLWALRTKVEALTSLTCQPARVSKGHQIPCCSLPDANWISWRTITCDFNILLLAYKHQKYNQTALLERTFTATARRDHCLQMTTQLERPIWFGLEGNANPCGSLLSQASCEVSCLANTMTPPWSWTAKKVLCTPPQQAARKACIRQSQVILVSFLLPKHISHPARARRLMSSSCGKTTSGKAWDTLPTSHLVAPEKNGFVSAKALNLRSTTDGFSTFLLALHVNVETSMGQRGMCRLRTKLRSSASVREASLSVDVSTLKASSIHDWGLTAK